jgi:hypothetical protein
MSLKPDVPKYSVKIEYSGNDEFVRKSSVNNSTG